MGIKVVGLMHTGVRITPEDGDVEKALSIWQDMLGLKIDSSRPDFPDIPGAWLNFAPNGADQGEPPQQIHIFGANGTSPRARTKREDPTRPTSRSRSKASTTPSASWKAATSTIGSIPAWSARPRSKCSSRTVSAT